MQRSHLEWPVQGGTSRIPNFAKRLQRDVKRLVDGRVGSGAKVEVRRACGLASPLALHAVLQGEC